MKFSLPRPTPSQKKGLLLAGLETILVLLLVLIVGWDGGVGRWFKGATPPLVREIESPWLNSPYFILEQNLGGSEVASSLADVEVYPAALTKLMTGLCAVDKIHSLKKTFTLTQEVFEGLLEAQASLAGYSVGEEVRAIDLLYGALVSSGSECTNALAIMASGSTQAFVDYMNKKAKNLGLKNTHFTNTNGLHDENQYSTCRELAIILRVALRNDTLREILETESYTTSPTLVHPQGLTFYSTLFQSMHYPQVTAGRILGGRTGYTDEAGLCLASFASVGGREYILVTCGAPYSQEPLHIYDAQTLYDAVGQKALALGYQAD